MQYVYYTDGINFYRDGVRSGNYVVDITTTALGFSGLQNTDWSNIYTLTI